METNGKDSSRPLSSAQGESATTQMNLKQIFGKIGEQFRKLNKQNEDGETRRKTIDRQIEELGKVIAVKTSGTVETKRETLDIVRNESCKRWRCEKFEGRGEHRRRKSRTELGMSEEQPSSGSDQRWQMPDWGNKGYKFWERRNYRRYEDYGDQNRPPGPNIDYSDGRIQSQMYLATPA